MAIRYPLILNGSVSPGDVLQASVDITQEGTLIKQVPITLTVVGITVAAPSSLTASNITETGFGLTWVDNADNEGAYEVSLDGGGTWQTLAANSTAMQVTGIAADTTVNVRVRAVSGAIYSNAISLSVTTLQATLDTPSGLTALNLNSESNEISWVAVGDADSYVLDYSLTGTGNWIVISGALTGTSYTHENLDPETEYYYRIKSRNATGDSDYSAVESIVTAAIPQTIVTQTYQITEGDPAGTKVLDIQNPQDGVTFTLSGANADKFTVETI